MASKPSKNEVVWARGRRRSSAQPKEALNARGLRSRERLKGAARQVLNEKGYRNIRVQDVTAQAGVASGLFYHYFRDLRELVAELSVDLFQELAEKTRSLQSHDDEFDWIFRNHLNVVELFSANPGILACLFGLAGDYDEFDRIWKDGAHDWNLQVAEFLRERAGFSAARSKDMAFLLGAMTEGFIYQSLIRKMDDLARFRQTAADTAQVIAVMWYRVIFLAEPPKDRIRARVRGLLTD